MEKLELEAMKVEVIKESQLKLRTEVQGNQEEVQRALTDMGKAWQARIDEMTSSFEEAVLKLEEQIHLKITNSCPNTDCFKSGNANASSTELS